MVNQFLFGLRIRSNVITVVLLWLFFLPISFLSFVDVVEAKPPVPLGGHILKKGKLPKVCEAGEGTTAYSTSFGYYYSVGKKQWVIAPWCYPRWGNLEASASTIIGKPRKKVTVIAFPTEGSNSGTYAPITHMITWTFPGQAVAGCGNADLTCTFIPFRRQTAEWQWAEVKVSMPRTFFIDSPGSNCAGTFSPGHE